MSVKNIGGSKLITKSSKNVTKQYWVRPQDWLSVPALTESEQKVYILMAVVDKSTNYASVNFQGAYSVDWGDGTSNNYSSGTTGDHYYDYASISSDSLSERGYKQVIITVTPQAGQNITNLNLGASNITKQGSASQFLEISASVPNATSVSIQSSSWSSITSAGNGHPILESLNIVAWSSSIVNISSKFRSLVSLQNVSFPKFNNYTNVSNLFQNCYQLKSAPWFNTSSATSFDSMFSGCKSLVDVPYYDTGASTGFSQMFNECQSLESIPKLNTSNGIGFGAMFQGCSSLVEVPELDFTKNTASWGPTSGGLFKFCNSLKEIKAIFPTTADGSTQAQSLFSECYALRSLPLMYSAGWTTTQDTLPRGLFESLYSIREIPAYNLSGVTGSNASNLARYCVNLTRSQVYGIKVSHSYANTNLGKAALEEIFTNLGTPATSQTITLSNSLGVGLNPAISKTSCGTTSGSTTITQSNTSSLVVGQLVTGTGISTGRSVTTQGATDTVTLTGHGLPNGRRVSFSAITTTTGIVVYTYYYVINATADTFQLATTPGGSVIDLVNDGTATLLYPTYITGITTNTNFTVDVPASATGTVTLVARNLDTSLATMKFWSVTG